MGTVLLCISSAVTDTARPNVLRLAACAIRKARAKKLDDMDMQQLRAVQPSNEHPVGMN
ncbi:hypothetical protein E4U15_001630 [Claviceps sp. LM218 group G6]|nr:hypothetical protein E4U15_001630 [Claviceps sp. LM218 group G6]